MTGIIGKLKKKRNNVLLHAVLVKIADALYQFRQGFPLGADEKEVVFMLSPEKKDLNVYIVSLKEKNEKIEITRMCAQYKGTELVSRLGDKLQAEGLNLSDMPMPGVTEQEEKGASDEQ